MLKLKRVAIDSGSEHVAYLSRQCTAYPDDEFHPLNRIEIVVGARRLSAKLYILDGTEIVAADEIGLGPLGFAELGLPVGTRVAIEHQRRAESLDALRRKIGGAELGEDDINTLIADMVAGRFGEEEIAAFLVASVATLSSREVLAFARARARHAEQMRWGAPMVVDKHSMGGVPGNRVTMIVVPIVAAHGLTIPKTSSRAITSPAGTADCMETLARVDLTTEEVHRVVAEARGCIAWNGRLNHSPVDEVMNRITRPLGLDSRRWSVASILSKKFAAGSTHVVIDLPVGPGTKLHSRGAAEALGRQFADVGQGLGMTVLWRATDGTQPIGNGVGPALEARDVLAVLRGAADAPADLRDKALDFAGHILEFDPAVGAGAGRARAEDVLASGAAMAAMERIISLQGPPDHTVAPGALVHEATAPADGMVREIDCYRIASIARRAGAPMDKGAGLDLLKKVGAPVKAGEPLYRIHAHIEGDFGTAVDMAAEDDGYRLS